MNSDRITARLRQIVEEAGVVIRAELHPGSLTVEFVTSPKMTWTWADCDKATKAILDSPFASPDKFGCRLEGEVWGTVGDLFSTDHNRSHDHWRFRIENVQLQQ